jgi:hypothetical protein
MGQIDDALSASHQAIVAFDEQSRVVFSTALADSLLGISGNNGSGRVVTSTIRRLDGSTLPSLLSLKREDLPALLRVSAPGKQRYFRRDP